jgi:large subunit ribosomal protein L17
MRHRKKFNHLSRKAPHRKAMLANMASSLILHKRITTTTAKAKALRTFVEPVITRSREDSTHSRRIAFKHLRDKHAVSELFREVAGKVGDRPGGYTRIIKLGNRPGDNADMCIIELVDYNENLLAEKAAAKSKATRRRRGGKKKADQPKDMPAAETMDLTEEAVAEPEAEAKVEESEAAAEPEAEVKEEDVPEEKAAAEVKADSEEKKEDSEEVKKTPEAKAEDKAPAEEETKEEGEEEKKEE